LRAVAAAAGVSLATASLAMAGSLRVAGPTRLRVERAARRLGYVRNPALAILGSGHFRNAGRPLLVAAVMEPSQAALFRRLAPPMGMSVVAVPTAAYARLAAMVRQLAASAVVINRRGVAIEGLDGVHIIRWIDEGEAVPATDVVETHEWWGTTVAAVERIRAAGYVRPVAVLRPAVPRHWQDDVRAAALRSQAVPVLDGASGWAEVREFLEHHAADAVLGGMADLGAGLRRHGIRLPFAALLGNEAPSFAGITGWRVDNERRCQATLELIEQRLRFGSRPPRRIIIPPHWVDAGSMPIGSPRPA
jgi:hypothetical protein